MIAAIQDEAEWRRVKNLVAFLHTGQPNIFQYLCQAKIIVLFCLVGLSAADWSIHSGGSMPTTDSSAAHLYIFPSSGVTLRGSKSKVLENRDLCRIVVSYIPKPLEL